MDRQFSCHAGNIGFGAFQCEVYVHGGQKTLDIAENGVALQ